MKLREYIETYALTENRQKDLEAFDRMVDIVVSYHSLQAELEMCKNERADMFKHLRDGSDAIYILSEERDCLNRELTLLKRKCDVDFFRAQIEFYQKKLAEAV